MTKLHYLAITGGVGGVKLALGLSKLLRADELAFVVNTGDDFCHLGLHISPDVDTLIYTLAGECNPETGWGRRDESWQFMQALTALGGESWFQLGDKDLATHIERTRRLADGQTLSEVTQALAAALGVRHTILPMSNDAVHTRVNTDRGPMDFQHYFVREQCKPSVTGFVFEGCEAARINPAIDEWLDSDRIGGIILCPSNPFVSVDPILAVPGLRQRLRACRAPVVAVSPVVGGAAIKGPTVKIMRELSLPATAIGAAAHYEDILDGFVLDIEDAALAPAVESLEMAAKVTNTVMVTLEDRVQLARDCLAFIRQLSTGTAVAN